MPGLIITEEQREEFTRSYIETALSDVSNSCSLQVEDCGEECPGDHSDVIVTAEELSPETLDRLTRDAGNFFGTHAPDLARYPGDYRYTPDDWPEMGGYYFWRGRAGHGTGFGDWYETGRGAQDLDMVAARERLMEACRTEGERELYRGDDGKIHHGKSWGEIQRERNGS
jgi:hypothetical protein